jgi:hypothetical protein
MWKAEFMSARIASSWVQLPYRNAASTLCGLMHGVMGLVSRVTLFQLAWLLFIGLRLPALGKADVVLLRTASDDPANEHAIRAVSTFYGLSIDAINVDSRSGQSAVLSELKEPGVLAALISGNALGKLDFNQIYPALRRQNGSYIPILVFGIEAGTANNPLRLWSGGTIRDCASFEADYKATTLNVQKLGTLTGTLAGSKLPAVASPDCRLRFDNVPTLETVLSTDGDDDSHNPVVLLRVQSAAKEAFFAPQMHLVDHTGNVRQDAMSKAFSSHAEYILFLSYAAGSRAWHPDGRYANLTIDDPWLTQPYGNLDYSALLAEMDRHNFHTTIAFIPWNFDRSEPQVVSLFLTHPERFSICMHGNNHAHQEFGAYERNPLNRQIADIKQGIARMERFRSLTGIPYDRFMVFPHAVAPGKTFALLTLYGFSGTANSSNVPMNTDPPSDLGFVFRPSTSVYGGLLSLYRHPAVSDLSRTRLAIESFLGNPLLFYSHENLFEGGAGAFNRLADFVNELQSDVRWTSLGEIARHSHLIRSRLDGNFDVLMFSNEMDLVNPGQGEREFFLTKAAQSSEVESVTVDGSPATFRLAGNVYSMSLSIPAHQVCKVRFTYKNDLDLEREDVRKSSLYSYSLRIASDFRDLYLSRSKFGSALIRAYYLRQWDKVELYLEGKWWLGVALFVLVLIRIWYKRLPRKAGMAIKPSVGGQ